MLSRPIIARPSKLERPNSQASTKALAESSRENLFPVKSYTNRDYYDFKHDVGKPKINSKLNFSNSFLPSRTELRPKSCV
jgi:hypothetical protein